jgi:paraquat-inducible protein B
VAVDWRRHPVELPTLEGPADDLPGAVSRLVAKLDRVPVEELAREGTLAMRQMRHTLEDTSRVMGRVDTELAPRMTELMTQAHRTMGTVEQAMAPDAPLQQDLRRSLHDLGGASYALRSLAEYLERHPESLLRGKKEDRP